MAKERIFCDKVGEIEGGGMAKLTLAITSRGNKVVVRELLPINLFRWRLRRGFVNGTRIRELLSPHPNIVYSLERGRRGLVPYEIIEYVDGLSLRRLLQTRDECLDTDTLAILRQAACALSHVHRAGFVHLDIKPENFLVRKTPDGPIVKLTDFDLAREAREVRTRRQAGTLAYMAPEQIRKGIAGQPADIFAFGILAYYVVAGRVPFHGKSEKKLRWRQTSESYTPKSPREFNPALSEKIEWVIMKCLEKNPEKRFPDMALLCQELESV